MAILIVSTAILSIILGIIVLIFPKMLNRIIAIWLIAYGVLQLMHNYFSNNFADLFSLKEILLLLR